MAGSVGIKDEIKDKIDLVELFSEYVQVKKSGASYMALCPFHGEKTPSLHVSPEKGMWYCHGCGEGGDAFGFVMRMEGLDFTEALHVLAKRAGVVIKEADLKASSERQRLVAINGLAARYYHEVLLRSSKAQAARDYVARRGLSDHTVDEFMIGYAPDAWDETLAFLAKKGIRGDEAFAAGLASKSDRGRGFYDRFRGRLMFPIFDHNSNVVGFTARVLPGPDGKDPKDQAKYINTSQTLVYSKSRVLYGLNFAKQDIRKANLAVVVEGNMDVIASHQAGVRNVVGSSGTSFTEEQLALLKRFAEKLVLSFDNDAAGETAARRSIDAAVAAGFVVRILRLPPEAGKDPDDCIRKGPALWQKAINDAVPFMEWYMALARERTDFKDPDSIRQASQALLAEVAKLQAPVERSHWLRRIAEMFDTPESSLFEEVEKRRKAAGTSVPAAAGKAPKTPPRPLRPRSRSTVVSSVIVGSAMYWPDHAETVVGGVEPELIDDDHRDLYRDFVVYYNDQRHGDAHAPTFRQWSEDAGNRDNAERAAILELLAEKELGELTPDARRDAIVRLIGELKQLHKARRQRELTAAMAQAERSGDMAKIEEIQEQLNELIL